MKTVRYLAPAQRALLKHRNVADRIMAKVDELARNPDGLANQVKKLKDRPESRLRVGDFRVLFLIDGEELLVLDIGPRGNIYE